MLDKVFVDKAISCIQEIHSKHDAATLRDRLFTLFDSALPSLTDENSRGLILSLQGRLNVANSCQEGLNEIFFLSTFFQIHSLAIRLSSILPEQQALTLSEHITSQFASPLSDHEKEQIVQFLSQFSGAQERLEVCSLLCSTSFNGKMPSDLMLLSNKIPPGLSPFLKRQVLHFFIHCFFNEKNSGEVVALLGKISSLRCKDLRRAVFGSLVSGLDLTSTKAIALTVALQSLSKQQKQELIKIFDKVLPHVQDSAGVVEIVHNLVLLMDVDLLHYIDTLLDQNNKDITKWSRYVDAVVMYDNTDEVEMESFFIKETIRYLLKEKDLEQLRYEGLHAHHPCFQSYEEELLIPTLMEFLKNKSRSELVPIISLSSFFLPDKKICFLQFLSELPQDIRESVTHALYARAAELDPESMSHITFLLMFFPDKHKSLILNKILYTEDFAVKVVRSPFEFVGSLCNNPDHKDICLDVHNHLVNVLQTYSSTVEASCVAGVILSHMRMFNVEEGSSLYILSLCVLTWAQNTTSNKNPYALYQKIVASSKKPSALDSVFFPFYEVGDQFISLSKSCFQNSIIQGVPWKEVLRISQGISFSVEHFDELLEGMFCRLSGMSAHDRGLYARQVTEITGSSPQLHFENLESAVFRNILHEPVKKNVSLTKAMFSSILAYIFDQPLTVSAGGVLTDREKAVMMFSESIQNCRVGKIEGIRMMYAMLDPKYKFCVAEQDGSLAVSSAKEVVRSFFEQKILFMISSDSPFTRELTGVEPGAFIPQLAHQSRYIRNKILPQLGLSSSLEFDLYTETLSDKLVGYSDAELLKVFFKHLPLDQLIQEFRSHLSRTVLNELLYSTFAEMLSQHPERGDCWDVDIGKVDLTDIGLIRIFEAAGIFHVQSIKSRQADLLLALQRRIMQQLPIDSSSLYTLPKSIRRQICFHLYELENRAGRNTSKDPRYGENAFYSKGVSTDRKIHAINKEICNIIMELFTAHKKEQALSIYQQMNPQFKLGVEAELRRLMPKDTPAERITIEQLFDEEPPPLCIPINTLLESVLHKCPKIKI